MTIPLLPLLRIISASHIYVAAMARLNEPAAQGADSIDVGEYMPTRADGVAYRPTVKRRFLRQNRELAKCVEPEAPAWNSLLTRCRINSTQSARIRNLETEGSRLLAENLSLRKHIIQLERSNAELSSGPSLEHLDVVKGQLQAKIGELGDLVSELGACQTQNVLRSESRMSTKKRNLEELSWRNGAVFGQPSTFGSATAFNFGDESRLPTINEDQFYPRKTLEYAVWSTMTWSSLTALAATNLAKCSTN